MQSAARVNQLNIT